MEEENYSKFIVYSGWNLAISFRSFNIQESLKVNRINFMTIKEDGLNIIYTIILYLFFLYI